MKWKVLVAAIVLGLLLIWPSSISGQDDISKLDTALAPAGEEKVLERSIENYKKYAFNGTTINGCDRVF